MKNIDMLAKAMTPEAPAPAPAAADPDKMAADLVDKIAARVVQMLADQQTQPEPVESEPEPEAGGDDDAGKPAAMD